MQGEAAEAANLDAITSGQGMRHLLKHSLDGQLDIPGRQLPLMGNDAFDQLRLGHGFPLCFKRLDHL
ncbi:hypothetical protein D3C71_2197670 [compost metagenome]